MALTLSPDGLFGITKNALISTEVKNMARPAFTMTKENEGKKLNPWGDDNDFPQLVIKDVRKNPELGTLLEKKANLLYGGGIEWGIPTRDESGKEVFKPVDAAMDLAIRLWCKRTNINRYISEAATDLEWFNNVFPEIILSLDRKTVLQLCTQAAEECRFSVQDNRGVVQDCYINAQWDDGEDFNSKLTAKIAILDPYYDPAGTLLADTRGTNYIYPLNYANPGSKFYQLASWNSIRESGWLAVAELIPKFKKALLENQATLKYHIEISNQYWEQKFPGYEALEKSAKTKIKIAELQSIQDLISGAEKTGTNFWSTFHSNLNEGKDNDLIRIKVLDDKLKDGKFLEDGKDASTYTMSAVGLHPALVGTTPNNGLGGAGSNIREAYNLHMLTNKSRQDLILEPLNNLIIEYNGWPEDMVFRFKPAFMTTLDTNTEIADKPQKQTTE